MRDQPVPIFDLKSTFDTTIPIGDALLPVHVKRFSRTEMEAFKTQWDALMNPRGVVEADAAAVAQRETDLQLFFETSIRDAITLDEGLVRDRGLWVTDGAGLIEIFHARKDVLSAFLVRIYVENALGSVIRKNSNSPRDSDTGSEPSMLARGGVGPASTADSAAPSGTAPSAAAMAVSGSAAAAEPESSGPASDEPLKVH